MKKQKDLMTEAAILYYEKNCTQQEIAAIMGLSRQTVSKLLNDAVREHIVEIRIHRPENRCSDLEARLHNAFPQSRIIVSSVSGTDDTLRTLMTVKKAAEFLLPLLRESGKNIGISWGRTIQQFILELPAAQTSANTVFPLFGATDCEQSYFSSNELARSLADKISADVKYAWFPYRPESPEDCELFRRTSYYKRLLERWNHIDIAIVGIGDNTALQLLDSSLGQQPVTRGSMAGDIATHFFTENGSLMGMDKHTLCASGENLKAAGMTVAIACGDSKLKAITGALRTGIVDVLITDEYTAQHILERIEG